jgi:ech hydrogenase subunit D
MYEDQTILTIQKEELMDHVQKLSQEGYRIIQISCTQADSHFLIDYSFDKDYRFFGLRVALPIHQPELPSISKEFLAAFLYENEIHDLFGIKVNGMAIDYGGKFYRIEAKTPFVTNTTEQRDA